MSYWNTVEVSELLGKTFTEITVGNHNGEIKFVGPDGSFLMHHIQDCCEDVRLEEVVGDLGDLIGEPIFEAEVVTNSEDDPPEYPDSWTWTFYKLGTRKGFVTLRWLGESNGYYSEGVDLQRIEE